MNGYLNTLGLPALTDKQTKEQHKQSPQPLPEAGPSIVGHSYGSSQIKSPKQQ